MDTLASLYDTAKIQRNVIITTTSEEEAVPIPTDLRRLIRITRADKNSEIYEYVYPEIIFSQPGLRIITYLSKPVDVGASTAEPEINEAYHMILALYIASKEYAEIDPNHPKAKELMSEFYSKASVIDNDLKNLVRRSHKIPRRNWA